MLNGTKFWITNAPYADTLVVYELYENEEALAAHLDGPLTKAIGREASSLIEGSKLERMTPLGGKGL